MRLARPPLFMSSPASMKNGIAISGKLSAPLMIFCATIWESNIPIVLINATPQMISANAMGIPSAIAPSSEKVKTAMVIADGPATPDRTTADGPGTLRGQTSVLLRFLDRDQIGFASVSHNDAGQIVEQ